MGVSLDGELAFKPALLLLHHLHRDQVLEIRVVPLQVVADVLICLRDPSRCTETLTFSIRLKGINLQIEL